MAGVLLLALLCSPAAAAGEQIDTAEIDTAAIDTAAIDTAEIDTAEIDTAEEARLLEAVGLRSMALADMESGNFGRAREQLLRLAGLLPDNVLPPVNLAICALKLGDLGAAERWIGKARALDPDNPRMLYTLARVLLESGGSEERWSEMIRHFATTHTRDPRPYYLQAQRFEGRRQPERALPFLRHAVDRAPDNLVLLVELLVAVAAQGDGSATEDALYAVEDRLDGFESAGFEGNLADFAGQILDAVAEGEAEALAPAAVVMRNLLRPTELYQLDLVPLTGGGGQSGRLFPQLDFDPPLPKRIAGGLDLEISFADDTAKAGMGRVAAVDILVATHEPGAERLLAARGGELEWLALEDHRLVRSPLAVEPPVAGLILHYDFDQDGTPDLVAGAESFGLRLYRGLPGGFAPATPIAPSPGDAPFRGLFALDLDHEGDLDLFVTRAGAPDLYYQNNGDGSWSERAAALGLDGGCRDSGGAVSADFDDDGDLDLVVAHPDGPPALYLNRRAGALREATAEWRLDAESAYRGVAAADFDNDGAFDLLLWGEAGGRLLLNSGDHFRRAELPAEVSGPWRAAVVADFDNDGDRDIVVLVGEAVSPEDVSPEDVSPEDVSPLLIRNRQGVFEAELVFEAEILAPRADGVVALTPGDFDADGDVDLVAHTSSGRLLLWTNEGGNRNGWVRLSLRGKNDNNAKNNTQGLFVRIEARTGQDFQVLIGNGGVNHLGLAARRQADVIRVVWTNGLSQTWQRVATEQTLVEEQVLKGSCPFLYSWNGEAFTFVTDLMWSSPLGMAMADGSRGSHRSARDWVLIPGEALAPAGGELWLQVTEELWETAYVDRLRLLAVDHPVEQQLVVDEKLGPGQPRNTAPEGQPRNTAPEGQPRNTDRAPIYWLGVRAPLVAARDHRGTDVLAKLARRDGTYVDDLPLERYQGLTRGHHVELTFESVPRGRPLTLFLWGWIFPTDSSINFALAQDTSRNPHGPSLEILGPDGRWRAISDFIGFPKGKRKAVVVELEPLDRSGPLTLRLATNLQIYWDAAALGVGRPAVPTVVTDLDPTAADLHFRGYSRLYRPTPSSPHLFDYRHVGLGPRFRDMRGAFTRYGRVGELLSAADDRYVVMNAGDELTVRFDASPLPELPPGWRRDYVLYTDGWVKDGDLHTAASQTVGPLPYHGMSAYPDRPRHHRPQHHGPDDTAYRTYLRRYQTREVSDRPFREALRQPEGE